MNSIRHQSVRWLAVILASGTAVIAAERKTDKPASTIPSTTALFGDKVIAKGKGVEVKQSQVDEMFITFKANRAAVGQKVSETLRPRIEADILEKLIATQLFLKMATETDKAKGKEIADLFIAEQIKQMPSEDSFNRQLISLGMTPQQFRAQILEQSTVKAVIDRELKPKIVVTDAQVKEFYDNNQDRFQEPELVKVRHILISMLDPNTGKELPPEKKTEKQRLAQKVLTRAKGGDDFVWLAKEYSDDAASKNKGGEYVIARGQETALPEFEGAAFSLGTNQVSDLVTTRFGYHVLKVIDKAPARKIEFAKVEGRIKETLLQEEVQKQLPDYVAKLKKEAGVEIRTASEKP